MIDEIRGGGERGSWSGSGEPESLARSKTDAMLMDRLSSLATSIDRLSANVAGPQGGRGGSANDGVSNATTTIERAIKESMESFTHNLKESLNVVAKYEQDGVTKTMFAQWRQSDESRSDSYQKEYEEKIKMIEKTRAYTDIMKSATKETGDLTGILSKFNNMKIGQATLDISEGKDLIREGSRINDIGMIKAGQALKGAGEEALLASTKMSLLIGAVGAVAMASEETLAQSRKITQVQESYGYRQHGDTSDRLMGGILGRHMTSQRMLFEVDKDETLKRMGGMQRRGVGAGMDPLSGMNENMAIDTTIGVMNRGYNIGGDTLEKIATSMSVRFAMPADKVSNALVGMAMRADKAGMAQAQYMENVEALNEATKQFGRTYYQSESIVQAFNDVLKRQIINQQTLVALSEPSKMGMGQQVWLGEQMGFKGNFAQIMEQLQNFANKDPNGFITAQTGIMRKAVGGEGVAKTVMTNMLAKSFNEDFSGGSGRISTMASVMNDSLRASGNKNMGASVLDTEGMLLDVGLNVAKDKGIIQSTKDLTRAVIDYGLGPIGTSIDPINNIAQVMVSSADRLSERSKQVGEDVKGSKASGGGVSEDGKYQLHAGEHVLRPGERAGGTISIELGPGSIVVGGGDTEKNVDLALDRLKGEIMKEVNIKWREAVGSR